MKKKILSAVLAFCMVFGSAAALPEGTFTDTGTGITASAWDDTYKSGNYEYEIEDGKATITKYNGKESNVTIPSKFGKYTVTGIGNQAFAENKYIKTIKIPETVTYIDWGAFKGSIGLSGTITIPSKVSEIEDYAFSGCISIAGVVFKDGAKKQIGENAFSGCKAIKSVDFGKSVINIKEGAFSNCSSIKNVTVPDSVTYIGGGAFENCISINSAVIGNGVTEIGNQSFANCKKLSELTIGNNVTVIDWGAFKDCVSLPKVTIPAKVSNIEDYAFNSCTKLNKVDIKDGVKKEIGECAFSGCRALTDLYIAKTVDIIGEDAFNSCTSLKSVTIPDSVISLRGGAFENCTSLKTVVVGNGVETIGNQAFGNCKRLTNVTLGKKICTIEWGAFKDDTSLTSIVIPESVRTIEDYAFNYCKSMTSAVILGAVEIGSQSFEHCENLKEVYLTDGNVTVSDEAFYYCPALKSITIPNSTVEIEEHAFGYNGYDTKVSGFTVRGFKGSQAQTYAKNNGFKFESVNGCKHSSYKKVYTVAPTCTAGGYTIKICTRCSKVVKGDTTKATGHKYTSSWKTTSFDFAKKTSTQTRKCSVCGKKATQTTKNAITRLAGANRYDSAAVISKTMHKTSDTVIVATGLTFNDALVAVPLASAYNAPLLLATERHITAQTEAELKRLKAKNVIFVSTNGAIGAKAKAEFKAAKYNMTYIEGKTSFETAAKVAKALQTKTKKAPTTIFFATDSAFADALSASPVAAIKGAPIMYLKNKGSIDKATADYLKSVKGKVKNAYIIGGDGVISDAMMKNVANALGLTVNKTVVRVAGVNRYETCVAVNNKFKSVLTGDGICVAKGLDFPDALAGGVYAAATKQALFLADGKKLQDYQNTYLKGKNASKITVFGGTGAVPDELVKLIAKASV